MPLDRRLVEAMAGRCNRDGIAGMSRATVCRGHFMRMWSSIVLSGLVLALASPVAAQEKKVISTPDAPQAIGPSSQAIRAGKTLYLRRTDFHRSENQTAQHRHHRRANQLVLENLNRARGRQPDYGSRRFNQRVLKDLNEFAR